VTLIANFRNSNVSNLINGIVISVQETTGNNSLFTFEKRHFFIEQCNLFLKHQTVTKMFKKLYQVKKDVISFTKRFANTLIYVFLS